MRRNGKEEDGRAVGMEFTPDTNMRIPEKGITQIHSKVSRSYPPTPNMREISSVIKNNEICGLQLPREPHRPTRILHLTGRRDYVISITLRQV